jgi:hypothetical protein
VDRPESGTVASGHVLVQALDSINTAELTELLVHVVGARARVVSEPDTEVLDLQGLLLVDLKGVVVHRKQKMRNLESAIPLRLPLEGCKGH